MVPVDEYTVGEVARLSGVSVRTLHHYDSIGLLSPGARSPSGYRLYREADLRRLRQVLFYRELDFGLDEIAEILADPATGTDDHLRRQHRMLRERAARTSALLRALEKEMEARTMGMALTPEEQFEIFGTDRMEEHAEEARQRWGDTAAWQESQRRSAAYTKEDWIAIKAEADASIRGFADAMRPASRPPGRQRWTWPRRTGSTSPAGSTTAATRCTAGWPRCTWPIPGTPGPTTRSPPASPGTCTTRSWPTQTGPGLCQAEAMSLRGERTDARP